MNDFRDFFKNEDEESEDDFTAFVNKYSRLGLLTTFAGNDEGEKDTLIVFDRLGLADDLAEIFQIIEMETRFYPDFYIINLEQEKIGSIGPDSNGNLCFMDALTGAAFSVGDAYYQMLTQGLDQEELAELLIAAAKVGKGIYHMSMGHRQLTDAVPTLSNYFDWVNDRNINPFTADD